MRELSIPNYQVEYALIEFERWLKEVTLDKFIAFALLSNLEEKVTCVKDSVT